MRVAPALGGAGSGVAPRYFRAPNPGVAQAALFSRALSALPGSQTQRDAVPPSRRTPSKLQEQEAGPLGAAGGGRRRLLRQPLPAPGGGARAVADRPLAGEAGADDAHMAGGAGAGGGGGGEASPGMHGDSRSPCDHLASYPAPRAVQCTTTVLEHGRGMVLGVRSERELRTFAVSLDGVATGNAAVHGGGGDNGSRGASLARGLLRVASPCPVARLAAVMAATAWPGQTRCHCCGLEFTERWPPIQRCASCGGWHCNRPHRHGRCIPPGSPGHRCRRCTSMTTRSSGPLWGLAATGTARMHWN